MTNAAVREQHSLVAVKVHPAVKFNFELKFILGVQDEPQEKIANELSIWQFIGSSSLLVKMNFNHRMNFNFNHRMNRSSSIF